VVLEIVNGAVPVETVLVITPDALKVVNTPELGVVLPIELGELNVLPLSRFEFKFATTVVDVTVILVNAPELGVVLPIGPGELNVFPFNVLEFKFATTVLDVTVILVNDPLPGIVLPIFPGELNVFPLRKLALRLETTVEDEIVNGLVPVLTVLVNIGDVTDVPTNNFFPIPTPPNVVKLPPFDTEVASVVLPIPIPPDVKIKVPVLLLVLGVVFPNDIIPGSRKFVIFAFQYELDIQ
jgi:hypothetical protein